MGGYQPVRRQEQQSRRQNFSRRDSRQPNRYQSDRYQNWRKPQLKRDQATELIATTEVKAASGRSPSRKSHWLILVQLFKRYPLLLLLSVWLILLLMAGIAATTMMNLDYSKQPSPVPLSSPIATAEVPVAASPVAPPFPNPTAKQSDTALSLLSLLGIVLTCATGCVMFLRYLNPRRPAKRVQSLTSNRSTAHRSKSKTAGSEVLNPQPVQSPIAEASVVPPEASHPLDWDEPSLADSLDLRQRQPLSRWL